MNCSVKAAQEGCGVSFCCHGFLAGGSVLCCHGFCCHVGGCVFGSSGAGGGEGGFTKSKHHIVYTLRMSLYSKDTIDVMLKILKKFYLLQEEEQLWS